MENLSVEKMGSEFSFQGLTPHLPLSVFIKKDGKYKKPAVIQVGGRGERGVEDFKFEGNKIILKTLEYHEDPIVAQVKKRLRRSCLRMGNLLK